MRVTRVVDGDTFDVAGGQRIRLYGVDCPERGQPYTRVAKDFTAGLALGREVRLIGHGRDRNGRLVAEVVLADGRQVGRELVRAGLAWWFRRYAPEDATLSQLEAEARTARRGLWADTDPVPPWEWRANRRPAGR